MELNYNLLLAVAISVMASWYLLPKVRNICHKKKLYDSHDERTVHTGIVPRLGGVVFFPVFFLAYLIIMSVNLLLDPTIFTQANAELSTQWMLAMIGLLILYLTGVGDDLVGVRYRLKLIMQIVAAGVFILSGVWIDNLQGLFGIHELPAAVGIPLTLFVIVFIVNAINFIDGIDGLASGVGMLTFLFYGLIFDYLDMSTHAIMAFIAFGMLIPFFYFNVYGNPAKQQKIFMGDSGSLTIGLLMAYFAVKLTHANPTGEGATPFSMVLAFSVLIVPLFDATKVILGRILSGRSPFKPDTGHIHHRFLQMGFTHRRSTLCILLLVAFYTIGTITLFPYLNTHLLFGLVVAIWVALHFILKKLRLKDGAAVKAINPASKWEGYSDVASGVSSNRKKEAPREE